MRLEKIIVTNFKGLKAATFEPGSFGCLVGENNAGKSSLLQSIVFALNRPTSIPIGLFYDATQSVEFRVCLSGVTEAHLQRLAEEHREKIASIVVDETLTLTITYPPGEKLEITTTRLIPRDERLRPTSIAAVFEGKRGVAIRTALIDNYPEFSDQMPDLLNVTAAKGYLRDRIAQLPREEFDEEAGAPLPSGISTSINALLPEPIYIPAVRNLSDELKTTQSTSFGRLLGLLLEEMTPDLAAVNQSLAQLSRLLNRGVEAGQELDQRHPRVRGLEALIESLLRQNFPQVKVELKVPPPELKTILNAAQIFIDDGSRDLVDNKGDGIKRSLTFALLQAYVHMMAQQPPENGDEAIPQRPLLFLFEEPELYLHPRSQRVLFNTLAQISDTHQVVVTTHSPMFFAPGVTASFVRVAKVSAEPKPVGVLFPVSFSLDQANADSFRLARFENADAAFFCRRVVLFEGESDDAYCKHIAKLLNPEWDFDAKNVALTRVSGKGNFARFRAFFGAFGIEVKLVADLDALFDGYQHLGADAEAAALRNSALQQIDDRIAALGIKAEPAARQIKDKINGDSWKARYQTAKLALREIQATGTVDQATLDSLDQLFVWEQEIARVRACREDVVSAGALVPVLDQLRMQGICVLSRGAIEDYYPADAPTSGPKPERALAAGALIHDRAGALAVSRPLAAGRVTELEQIFEEIFREFP